MVNYSTINISHKTVYRSIFFIRQNISLKICIFFILTTMITECKTKSLQFDGAATKALLALCQPATNDRLKEILGAAYNARYMSIDRPAEFSTTTDDDDFLTPKLMTNDSLLKRPQLKPKNRLALEDRMLSDGSVSKSNQPTSSNAAFAVSPDFKMPLRNSKESYADSRHRSKRQIKFPSGRKLYADAPGFAQPVKSHLPWTCRQEIRWVDLGADYFPRYLRAIHCTSDRCFYGHYFCRPKAFTVSVLKRSTTRRVDCLDVRGPLNFGTISSRNEKASFQESWTFEEVAVNFCCECTTF